MAEDVDGALSVRVMSMILVMPLPVTVIVPLLFPMMAVEVFTLTVIVPLLLAAVGVTVSQLPLLLTVQEVLEVIVND